MFNIGDVVLLKSGGPVMTIDNDNGDGTYWCQWFDKNGELKGASFKGETLKSC